MLVVEMAKYLAEIGLGKLDETGANGNIFVGVLPESPDECISLYPTGGQYSPTGEPYDDPTVQIIVRGGQDPRTPAELAQSIYDALHGFRGGSFVDGGAYIVSCRGLQSAPAHIGRDENRRHEYSVNFQLRVFNPNRRQ